LRGCSLQIVHCSLWVLLSQNRGPVPGVADSGLERAAHKVLEEGVALAKETVPDLDVRGTLLHGMPRDHLVHVSSGTGMKLTRCGCNNPARRLPCSTMRSYFW
jgi:hypothetical protein